MNYTRWILQLCLSCLACIMLDRPVLAGTAVHRPQARDIHETNRVKGMVASPRVQVHSKSASVIGNPGRRLHDRQQVRLNGSRSPAHAGLQRIILVTKPGATVTVVPGESTIALHPTSIPPPYAGGPSLATTRTARTSSTLTSTKISSITGTTTVSTAITSTPSLVSTAATSSTSTSTTSTTATPATTSPLTTPATSTSTSTTSTATPTTTSSSSTTTTSSTATTTSTSTSTSSTSSSTTSGTTVSSTTQTTTSALPPLCYPSQGTAPMGSPCVNPTYDPTKCCATEMYCYEGTVCKFS